MREVTQRSLNCARGGEKVDRSLHPQLMPRRGNQGRKEANPLNEKERESFHITGFTTEPESVVEERPERGHCWDIRGTEAWGKKVRRGKGG